jgi:two-component system, NarL family, sensor histidine kinase DevS
VEPDELVDTALSDELLRSAIDAAADGILVVDGQGLIEFVNPMAANAFGYTFDELHGQRVEILVPAAVRSGHESHRAGYMDRPRARGMGSGLDLHGVRKTGEEFPVEISLSPVRSGDQTHVIAVIRDVSERRAASQELMRAHEQLALVDDRERIARDLHDTVIQRLFAVGLSLQGALGGVTDPKMAERIETAINEIDGTIRDIRTAIFSLHARRAPTAGVRDDILVTTREAARALGFEPQVTFDGPVDAATSETVREHVIPALREMLSNVVKHANATQVFVSVVVHSGEIHLVVRDNGIGVVDAATGGRGLGNVTERAEGLGGQFRLRPAEGGGTCAEWRVPLGIDR